MDDDYTFLWTVLLLLGLFIAVWVLIGLMV